MRGTLRRDGEAVSPVIATVLLLAITVMLSSMVFVLMQGALTTVEKAPPQATVSVRALDNGFHVVRITSLDQSIDPARLKFDLQPSASFRILRVPNRGRRQQQERQLRIQCLDVLQRNLRWFSREWIW